MGRFIFLLWGVKWIIIHLFKLFPKFARFKGLSKNYVVKTVGMNSTRFSTLTETLFLVTRVEHQKVN